jgi:hypothetical protein
MLSSTQTAWEGFMDEEQSNSQQKSGFRPRTPEERYEPAYQKARQDLQRLQPQAAAVRAGALFEAQGDGCGEFTFSFFGSAYHISWPDGLVRQEGSEEEADVTTAILLLHYLAIADGTPFGDKWIAFRNLPGGMGYDAAFQGRANLRLAYAFGTDRSAFESACRKVGGERISFGDASFVFRVLPRSWLAVVLYFADEEFSPNANVLFDGAASHYLSTEDLAVLGGMLASRLIKAARAK